MGVIGSNPIGGSNVLEADIVKWQNVTFPRLRCGSDSRYPHHFAKNSVKLIHKMAIPKEYFHDRMVLLLLTVSAFLAALGTLLVLLKFNPGRNEGYITQYRANLGISGYKTGHASDLLAFIIFLLLILLINTIISMRVYHIHRQFSIVILGMGVLLMVLAIIVSNALLILP